MPLQNIELPVLYNRSFLITSYIPFLLKYLLIYFWFSWIYCLWFLHSFNHLSCLQKINLFLVFLYGIIGFDRKVTQIVLFLIIDIQIFQFRNIHYLLLTHILYGLLASLALILWLQFPTEHNHLSVMAIKHNTV